MKRAHLSWALALLLAPASALAAQQKLSCERFQSNCNAGACYQLVAALQNDVERKIFTVRKTEIVEYTIDATGAIERLRGEQAVFSKERQPVVQYKNVADEQGKIVLTNVDKKGKINAKVEIQPTSGFYLNFLIHTDGSIPEVPIGEPYLAYFGWCANGDLPPAPAPATTALPPTVDSPAAQSDKVP